MRCAGRAPLIARRGPTRCTTPAGGERRLWAAFRIGNELLAGLDPYTDCKPRRLVREVVLRALSRLQVSGLIEIEGREVRINNIEALRDYCASPKFRSD